MYRLFLYGGPADGAEYDHAVPKGSPPKEAYVAIAMRAEYVYVYKLERKITKVSGEYRCRGWIKMADVGNMRDLFYCEMGKL